jgi:NitT/TauT family transport system permease protein
MNGRVERLILPLIAGAVVVLAWTIAVRVSGTKIFPTPLAVARGVAQLAERGLLWRYAGDSLFRVAVGYLLAVVLGIPLGILFGWNRWAAEAANPIIQMVRPISPLAWMPLAVIWFGISNAAPIFLIFLASLFPIVVATMNGVRSVSPVYLQAGRNFGLRPATLLRRVVFPAVLPRILTGLRIAFGIAWLVLVAAEMIGVDSGLGYLIIDARNAGNRYDLVIAGMLLIGVLGLGLDTLIRRLERVESVRWGFNE